MKKIGIIGAMQIEIDLVLEKMEVVEEYTFAGFTFITGFLYGKEIVLTRCGVGKVNAAACTQILIDKFNIDCVINTGIAGGMKEDIRVCDMVISSEVTHHDVRKAQMKNLFPFQEAFTASEKLVSLAINACQRTESRYHYGKIVSGECFVDNKSLKDSLINEYSPACVEMEGSSVGHVSYINNIPFLVIRCISDNADEEATITYDNFEKIAGNQSALIVIEMIKNL